MVDEHFCVLLLRTFRKKVGWVSTSLPVLSWMEPRSSGYFIFCTKYFLSACSICKFWNSTPCLAVSLTHLCLMWRWDTHFMLWASTGRCTVAPQSLCASASLQLVAKTDLCCNRSHGCCNTTTYNFLHTSPV